MSGHIFRLLNMIQKPDFWPLEFRHFLLRRAGIRLGKRVVILSGCHFIAGSIEFGEGCFLNTGCLITGTGGIIFGNEVRVGPRTIFLTDTHEPGGPERRAGPVRYAPIRVGDGCWLGAAVTVLPGVEIGAGTVVAAGAVVTRSVAANTMQSGIPASRRRDLPV